MRPINAKYRNHDDTGSTGAIARSNRIGIPSSANRRPNSAANFARSIPGTDPTASAPPVSEEQLQ